MKRYLTFGIIFGVLVAIIVTVSWLAFPTWHDPTSGGFLTLLGATIIGVWAFLQSAISVWKDLKEEKKEEPKPVAPTPMQSINSQQGENIFNAPGGTINVYPPAVTSSEPTSEESSFWFIPHPYPMPPNFTGRKTELEMLDSWLADNTNRLFILRALGGFGKSALAWQWINTQVNPTEWTKLVWWSFYEGDASFEHFIEETLKYLKLEVPKGGRPQVDKLLDAMQTQKVLLIMDGFERVLRLYASMNAPYQSDEEHHIEENELDCNDINAEWFLKGACARPNIKSKVLMTTRLTPRTVKPRGEFMLGCREVELTSMQPADAVEFFRKQKIKGTRAEIEAACAPYGYHPLSLRILAGYIIKDFHNPRDIVVAQKLKIDGDIKAQKHHVLEVAYNSLAEHEQKLLSTIACFRSAVEFNALQSIVENKDALDNDIHDLVERGLLHFDEKNKKFDLHPIVRRYAYEHLTAPDRTAAHTRLRDYFAAVDVPDKPQILDDLAPVIELYHHMVKVGQLDKARTLYQDRLDKALHFQYGKSLIQIELLGLLFVDGDNKLPHLNDENAQAWTLNQLAVAYALSGQPRYAIPFWKLQHAIRERQGQKKGLAIGLGGSASVALLPIGALADAERNLRRSIELAREIGGEFDESVNRQELGHILSYRGMWNEAETEFLESQRISEKISHIQNQGLIWSYYAWKSLFMVRDLTQDRIDNQNFAIQFAQRALDLAERTARDPRFRYPVADFTRAYWLLGAAYRLDKQLDLAEQYLTEAITRDRTINLVYFEANILLDLARLRYDQKNYEEAKSLAEEALSITERCGYVLQGADVNLFLAQYALEREKDKVKAKEYAETALKLATCDGPPYYYKVAYEEAERMLERLKDEG